MRLIELEIFNIRGIRHIVLHPNGRNFVIWGPNGSGKSAVVDAIDFLLTGRMSRLAGHGTAGITLSSHGPHIGSQIEEAHVRGLIQVSAFNEPIEIERYLNNPSKLKFKSSMKSYLEPILDIAKRGQHVLTRREILRFITSDASTRAQQIQDLINAAEIENMRRALVKIKTDATREVAAGDSEVDQAKGAVLATTQQVTFHSEHVLAMVNECRESLGGQPLQELDWRKLKDSLSFSSNQGQSQSLSPKTILVDIQNLLGCFDQEFQMTVSTDDTSLRQLLLQIKADDQFLKSLQHLHLLESGLKLVDDSGRCPLCDVFWEPGKLHQHLTEKLSMAEMAGRLQEQISEVSSRMSQVVASVITSVTRVDSLCVTMGRMQIAGQLQIWLSELEKLAEALKSPIERYSIVENANLPKLFAPVELKQALGGLSLSMSAEIPNASPQQTAWDTLTRLEENLKSLESAELRRTQAGLWKSRAVTFLNIFHDARDSVLIELYESVRDRFVKLYRKLHEEDEHDFIAKLEPDGAGLTLAVDFYGRGLHPPHALHSEGHQDSMGVCLYLALAERLTAGIVDLVILDDVVMSVDADHRRKLCSLLASEFNQHQFLITTHDRTWAQQLRQEGTVSPSNSIEFFNWKFDLGPQVDHEVDLWNRIDGDLQRADVPSAAAKLRRGSEEFFSRTCDALAAEVPFKLSGRYELRDLIQGAMSRYTKIVKKAKQAAQSWGHNEMSEKLNEIDSIRSSIYNRTNAEQWAVNPNVHYNEWANFSPNDFVPVRDAFHDLFNLFQCSTCQSILRVLYEGPVAATLQCSCGRVSWNLKSKPRS